MLELLLLTTFLSVTVAALAAGFMLGSRRQQALRRALKSSRRQNQPALAGAGTALSRLLREIFGPVAFLFPDSAELRLKLVQAGYVERSAPLTYSSLRVMLVAALGVLGFVIGLAFTRSLQAALIGLTAGSALALLAPPFTLRRQIAARKQRLRKHLPDALDLLVICVEAGLAIDAAIIKVATELKTSHADMAQELRMVTQMVNAGVPRMDALREMSHRTGVREVGSLVGTLIQSERLGTSIARTLRLHSDQLRTKRRQQAEQAALRAPIKMLVPMVLFLLPALFIVVAGPVVLVLRDTFASAMR